MKYTIREKRREDSKDIVHVVTVSWNETYKGIVPAKVLAEMYNNEDERLEREYKKYDDESIHQFVLEVDDKVVGFINIGKSKEEEYPDIGQIYALYIINEYHGYGFGRKLFELGMNELKKLGYNSVIIGCLVGNPTN